VVFEYVQAFPQNFSESVQQLKILVSARPSAAMPISAKGTVVGDFG
jgi:hypothetical protein